MSNIVRDKHVSAIKERAQAFVSRCDAIEGSVNVYVSTPVICSDYGSQFLVTLALLCARWSHKFYV